MKNFSFYSLLAIMIMSSFFANCNPNDEGGRSISIQNDDAQTQIDTQHNIKDDIKKDIKLISGKAPNININVNIKTEGELEEGVTNESTIINTQKEGVIDKMDVNIDVAEPKLKNKKSNIKTNKKKNKSINNNVNNYQNIIQEINKLLIEGKLEEAEKYIQNVIQKGAIGMDTKEKLQIQLTNIDLLKYMSNCDRYATESIEKSCFDSEWNLAIANLQKARGTAEKLQQENISPSLKKTLKDELSEDGLFNEIERKLKKKRKLGKLKRAFKGAIIAAGVVVVTGLICFEILNTSHSHSSSNISFNHYHHFAGIHNGFWYSPIHHYNHTASMNLNILPCLDIWYDVPLYSSNSNYKQIKAKNISSEMKLGNMLAYHNHLIVKNNKIKN